MLQLGLRQPAYSFAGSRDFAIKYSGCSIRLLGGSDGEHLFARIFPDGIKVDALEQ